MPDVVTRKSKKTPCNSKLVPMVSTENKLSTEASSEKRYTETGKSSSTVADWLKGHHMSVYLIQDGLRGSFFHPYLNLPVLRPLTVQIGCSEHEFQRRTTELVSCSAPAV